MVAITAGIGRWLTGIQSPMTLRLGAVIWFTIALIGFYQLAGLIYGRRAGILALLLPHASPFFFVGAGAFVIPDNALTAAWVWFFYVTWLLRHRQISTWTGFPLLGLLTGISLLAKYHSVLLVVCFVILSVFDIKIRRWWLKPELYLAPVLALLVFAPCIIWNANNDWISFAEQFGKGTSSGFRFRFDLLGQAVGGQLGYLTPWLMFFLWYGSLKKRTEKKDDRWLLPFFLAPVAIFTLLGLTRGILPHWTMPGYIAAIVLTAGSYSSSRKSFKLAGIATSVNLLLVVLVVVHANTGLFPLKAKVDPTLDAVGWSESIQWLEENNHLSENDALFIHKWFTGGEVGWADKNRHHVIHLGSKPHNYAWWNNPGEIKGKSGVFLSQARYGLNEKDVQKLLIDRFRNVHEIEVPEVTRGKDSIGMIAWRCDSLVVPPDRPYGPFKIE